MLSTAFKACTSGSVLLMIYTMLLYFSTAIYVIHIGFQEALSTIVAVPGGAEYHSSRNVALLKMCVLFSSREDFENSPWQCKLFDLTLCTDCYAWSKLFLLHGHFQRWYLKLIQHSSPLLRKQ